MNMDAYLHLLDKNLNLDTFIAKGKIMVQDKFYLLRL